MGIFNSRSRRDGIAAVELGLAAPILISLCIGISDFSVVYHKQLQLSSALTAAGEYAFNKGQSESGTTLTSDVTSFLQNASWVTLSAVQVTINGGGVASDDYCASGSPAVFSGPYSPGFVCPDGSTAGQFISLSASYTYTPTFRANTAFLPHSFTQTLLVRLQ
jgi:Flp pilus assembly protein TadG